MHKYFTLSEFNRLMINDILIYLIPLLSITAWQFSNASIVFLTSTYSIGFILFSKLSGYLIDRHNSRIIPIYAYIFNVLLHILFFMFVMFHATSFIQIFMFILLLSLTSSLLEINTSVFIPDYFNKNLASVNSTIQFVRSIVNFISPIIVFTLSTHVIIAFTILITLQILNLCLYMLIFRKTAYRQVTAVHHHSESNRINAFKYIFSNKNLSLIILVTIGINFSMTILANTIVIYIIRDLHIDSKVSGIIISLLSIGAILGALIPTWILKRYSLKKSIGIVNLLLSLPFILILFDAYLFFVGVFLGYLCRSFGSVLRTTMQYQIIPAHIRGKVNSTIYLFTWGTIPIAGYTASVLLHWMSLHTLYTIITIVFILANSLFLLSEKMTITSRNDRG
ncbi:MFS transporter [Staphylococcus cornubiensis]|uniref:MFS transporter n=1 Tax=Staphylococcus cornubiensis TaxID=1986155 RepID=UPI0013566060|nr:MFS transporter [Staphylococcus cornubiensis]